MDSLAALVRWDPMMSFMPPAFLAPSSEIPPPGTIMWTCGWCVMAEPQLWSTAVMAILAPRCFGSAAMASVASALALNKRA